MAARISHSPSPQGPLEEKIDPCGLSGPAFFLFLRDTYTTRDHFDSIEVQRIC